MTQRYAHLSPDNLREAVQVLDKNYHNFSTIHESEANENGVTNLKHGGPSGIRTCGRTEGAVYEYRPQATDHD